ncbi:ferredoxin--NADP reductase [Mucilaginibacter phyllosphaerae]|uniref:Ferredoxin--NADP reductase n=1 Tax=Mucilaginibacter phyllosphaerae TaxID=1812349 RepID=A0A4Y8AEB5_9SPHI|nr:ferredoxin--NADP reductase [Mucilaginibacter phyllosphaerae]MBB3970428.1 ring-1,2-phenylacetyl-CoA epoxidase subunit PaaE [Mucilaginibacter phyllosphaerae]TEW66928.1 ferredoxin--NADP reductase [Mucilaginibacter phyllosphaerae]GGH12844.1 putative oxidoreductase [Mucilaginibacter phyllosphaerae]
MAGLLQLRVDGIKWELPDTATFYLVRAVGSNIVYKAGQFITLVFNHHNQEVRRSYSLSSSPDDERLAITVKRVSNGEISRFLLTRVNVGDVLNAAEPAGVFTVNDFEAEKDLVFFAAGSGITPIFSQIKYVLNRPGKSRLHLIYSNQDKKAVLFNNELNELLAAYPDRFNITHLFSSDANRLTNIRVEQLVKQQLNFDKAKAEFYLCGPFVYMRMIRLTLLYMGIHAPQIHKENFVLETVPVTGSQTNYPPKTIRINYDGRLHNVQAGENQSVLQAALQNKIQLPYSCRSGICAACVAFCKTGKVEMAKNEVLTDDDIAKGWILTCTGHALTDDVEIIYK